jgi:hypothetical protein
MNICELNTKAGELTAKIYDLMGAFEYLICTTPHLYPADDEQNASATPMLRLLYEELQRIDELATDLSDSIQSTSGRITA